LSAGEIVALAFAGLGAGAINTLVGSGTLLTFPVLIAFGYEPVIANVSNTIGLVPGSVSGAIGYRRELRGQLERARRLVPASILGSLTGAVLLLSLPASAFKDIVPVFIGLALVLTALQPRISRALAAREVQLHAHGGTVTLVALYLVGIYGGYFGAAQGVILMAILGVTLPETLQRTNAIKNVLSGVVNGVAGLFFVFAAPHIDWGPAGILAGASIIGGQLGARYGRRLPDAGLRMVIIAVGIFAIVRLMTG
jgi:uncharacterized membrane protein YfcA